MKRLLITAALCLAVSEAAPLNFGPLPVAESSREQVANLDGNARELSRLRQAAEQCVGMRLVMAESAEARIRRPVEIAQLSSQEQKQMRGLIARMQAVKTAPAGDFSLPHVVRLELLGQGGKVLAGINYMDVAPEALVSTEGYAAGSRYMLRGGDATAWHLLMRAQYARSIAQNPAPSRLRSRAPKPYEKVESPAPEPDVSPVLHEQEYFHTNCKRKHKGHKHGNRNHYCTHPQH